MDPTKFRNTLQGDEQPNIGVTHTIRCEGDGATSQVWMFDAVMGEGLVTGEVPTVPVLLTADAPATTAGSAMVLTVDAIPGGLAIGDTLFIWDVTNYRYREFRVADFDAIGLTITSTVDSAVQDVGFLIGDIVSFTPPFDDVYQIRVTGKIAAGVNPVFAYGFLDESPLAFSSINDLLTDPSLNWSNQANIATALDATIDEPPILLPKLKPSRYFCVVTDAVVAATEGFTAYISRRVHNSVEGSLDVNVATDIP